MGFASFSRCSVFLRALFTLVLLFIAIAETEAINFTQCYKDFNQTQNENRTFDGNTSIVYQGPIYHTFDTNTDERRFTLSVEGCQKLCDSGVQYYPWGQIAGTMTTWVLPIIGLLLQAPYESNEFRKTTYALVRWLGSPIASLSYILWNIKVIGKCAILSDMSTFYSIDFARLELEDGEGARAMRDMRDSLYILSVMNQYTVKSPVDPKQAETLLRVALFADINTPTLDLKERRRKLAMTLREGRKRGIVPVFITLMWFLFSLAISVDGAFSALGDNYTAHDLALGLYLAWLPVLILSSIVDRNPTQTATSCMKLNKLLREVQVVLRTDGAANRLIQSVKGNNAPNFILDWVGGHRDGVSFQHENPPPLASEFFNEFAGQGRVRWHYGVAHSILTGMETIILDKPDSSRNWLQIPGMQKDLVRGGEKTGLLSSFDLREFWEILSASVIVIGTISGAFILSYRTPTVGLGCRSGGYVIFGTTAAGMFFLELLAWYLVIAPGRGGVDKIGEKSAEQSRRRTSNLIAILNWIFRLCELVNTAWLVYTVMAQTLGSYETCACQAANWGSHGGYIDVKIAIKADGAIVQRWWITGTLVSSLIMFTAIAFLVIEWCEQSHLNTVELNKAMHGLKLTQHFKYRTLWIRKLWRVFSASVWKKGRTGIRWST